MKRCLSEQPKPGGTGLAANVQHYTTSVTAADTAWCVDSEVVEPVRNYGSVDSCVCVVAAWGRGWHAYPKMPQGKWYTVPHL